MVSRYQYNLLMSVQLKILSCVSSMQRRLSFYLTINSDPLLFISNPHVWNYGIGFNTIKYCSVHEQFLNGDRELTNKSILQGFLQSRFPSSLIHRRSSSRSRNRKFWYGYWVYSMCNPSTGDAYSPWVPDPTSGISNSALCLPIWSVGVMSLLFWLFHLVFH
jgi:hypothetical protein